MLAGAVVYSEGEKEGSDSRNTLKEEPTGFTINWMCSVGGRLAPCSRANSLAFHASPDSVPPNALCLSLHPCLPSPPISPRAAQLGNGRTRAKIWFFFFLTLPPNSLPPNIQSVLPLHQSELCRETEAIGYIYSERERFILRNSSHSCGGWQV